MADIFISYASQDSERAKAVAAAFRAQGWTVWWDDHISPGHRFDQTIEAELAQARCVVVLWSRASVASNWVREEAHEGKKRAVLVPALIGDVEPPFGYRTVQAANLVDWAPGAPHREFDTLVASIEQLAPRPKAAPKKLPPGPAPAPARRVEPLSERVWQRLLERMREGAVVPVIGQRLLLDTDDRTSLYARVAARMLLDCEFECPEGGLTPFHELSELAGLMLNQPGPSRGAGPLQDLYFSFHATLHDLRKQGALAPPRALVQLAQISDFPLFVTLTPDDLLAQALQAEGRTLHPVEYSPRLPTGGQGDLPHDWAKPPPAVHLLYAFGKAHPVPSFAFSQQEVEHYLDDLQARNRVPDNFLAALRARSLLFVGADYPVGLMRRIVRTLAGPRDGGMALPDAWWEASAGVVLTDPDRNFPVEWGGPPQDFVAELHRRWLAERAAAGNPAAPPAPADRPMFFISGSRHTDRDAARRLRDALVALGVAEGEIGFDPGPLEPDDGQRQRILAGIRNCRYFVAVVSHDAVARDEDFAFAEWQEATQRAAQLERVFLLPVVVDPRLRPGTYRQASVASWHERGIAFGHAPDGRPDEPLMLSLRRLVREARARADET